MSVLRTYLGVADGALRAADTAEGSPLRARRLVVVVLAGGMLYGAAMGSFGWLWGRPSWQVVYSAVKLPVLLLGTFGLSLPVFFVLNTLLGVRGEFRQAVRAILSAQAALTGVLASLAPVALLWYVSTDNYRSAVVVNAAFVAGAAFLGHLALRRSYRPLIRRNRRHRLLLMAWLVVFGFVGGQMTWILRPWVGDPSMPAALLRRDVWGNAYVHLFHALLSLLGL